MFLGVIYISKPGNALIVVIYLLDGYGHLSKLCLSQLMVRGAERYITIIQWEGQHARLIRSVPFGSNAIGQFHIFAVITIRVITWRYAYFHMSEDKAYTIAPGTNAFKCITLDTLLRCIGCFKTIELCKCFLNRFLLRRTIGYIGQGRRIARCFADGNLTFFAVIGYRNMQRFCNGTYRQVG
ncbi:hypothetical protein D3C76_1382030 [compost metagenome]